MHHNKNFQDHTDPMDPYNAAENRLWSFGRREKVLLAATAILMVVISIKSIYYDPYEPLLTDDMSDASLFIEAQYDGFLYDSHLLKVRIIEYKETDAETNLHLRKYFLGLFPIGDVYTEF